MQSRKNSRKKGTQKETRAARQKDIIIEDFYIETEADEVSDDTLEFLSLDDEFIEAYNEKQKSRKKTKKSAKKASSGRRLSEVRKKNKDSRSRDEEYDIEELYEDDEYEEEEAYSGDRYDREETYEDDGYEEEEIYEDDGYEQQEAYDDGEELYEEEARDDGYDSEEAYKDEYEELYSDEEYDEEYDEEAYEEDEEYEYDEYEDDDYEDDEYEDYDDEYDERGGVIVRFKYFLANMSTLDVVVAMFGILVLAGAIFSGGLYLNARTVAKQVDGFSSVGEEMAGISVIGESGLLAVSESAKLSMMIDLEEEEPEEEEEQEPEEEKPEDLIEVTLNLTSIQSDLKIKFVNKSTGKLIGGVPFAVEVSGKKSLEMKDDDKDGIIYQTGIAAGDYSVKVKPFEDGKYSEYKLPASASSVKITDTIAYKKVDVVDEVKTEAEVNVAAEDTAQQNTVVESTLKDTVEWVESTKTPIGDENAVYTEVDKKSIPDPWTVSSAFRKLVEAPPETNDLENKDEENKGDENKGEENKDGDNKDDSEIKPPSAEEDDKKEENTPVEFSVSLGNSSLKLETGKSASLTAAVSVTGGNSSTSQKIEWSSSDSGVADVDSNGNVTAKSAGSATVTATVTVSGAAESKTASCVVTVEEPSQPDNPSSPQPTTPDKTKVELNNTSLSLKPGATASLLVKVLSGEIQSVEWVSSDTSVVTVSNGGVTAVNQGSATITAKVKAADGNQELVCNVTVQDTYTKVTISGAAQVDVGKTTTLTAQTEPKDGKITWSSSDEKIAKVDDKGVVTGVAEGTAEIKAVCSDATSVSAVHKITVGKSTVDGTAKLKDKDGNQMYYLDASGAYVEAVYDDYKKYDKFFKKTSEASAYKYTGWQTIDGSVFFYDKDGNYVTGEQIIQGAKYNFGADGRLSSGSGNMGIDVSKWNGNIDWNAVKNSGVSYVIIRCGYRGSSTGVLVEDSKFRSNIKGAKAAGLKVGVYFFSQAVNEVEAVEEASMALSLASGYGLNYPIFLDVEASGGRGDSISKETRTAVCKAFCSTVQNSGCSAGIYANKTWFNEKINTGSLTGYKIWLAQYASAPTYTATRYDMWQYSSKGKVSGISGDVDMNISYLSY